MKFLRIIIILLFSYVIKVQSADNLKELKKQRKILFDGIGNTNKFINENSKLICDISQIIDSINLKINRTKKEVSILNKKIDTSNTQIYDKQLQLDQLERKLLLKKIYYLVTIQKIYQIKNNQAQLFFTFLENSTTQFSTKLLYLDKYSKWVKIQIKKITAQINTIIAEKQNLKYNIKEKTTLMDVKKNEEKKLQIQKKLQINNTKNLRENVEKFKIQINKNKNQIELLNKKIKEIIKQSKIKKHTENINKTKSELKIKKEHNLSTNITKIKNKFPFPLSGYYQIINHFGYQQYKNMKNIYHGNNGIDIKINKQTDAKSIFDGIITDIFNITEYKKSVIVKHENYIALYSYLEEVFVKKGEKVKTGQNIGRVYTNQKKGNLTILHFELWQENTRLNPELWLYL